MFVFRNYTIENLFAGNASFSGYEDISFIPADVRELVWLYQAPINFSESVKGEIIRSYADKLEFVASAINEAQTLYICSLVDVFPTNIIDSDNSVAEAISDFNARALNLSNTRTNIKYIDICDYFCQYPRNEWINWKFYFISQMIIAPKVASGFGEWFSHRLMQLNGYRKKCLVLDLDNTLWGGILGEDGVDGIKIGGDYPGNAFLYFQEALLALSKTGVILTVCSKNNESDVKEVWAKNPFLKITDKHLSAWRINWNNKADNIREIAAELNIGLDSMIFIDDNPSERELVKQQLPMVEVPDFPSKPYELVTFINHMIERYFKTPCLTKEDLAKTDQYKANARRASESKNFADLKEFIKSLDIKIDIFKADSFTVPRIAQMTQKTNQFNLTTRRYQEADITSFVAKGDWVIGASVKDKFGDSGVTAAGIIKINGDKAYIDSLLMSCRILGKDIEKAFLFSILNKLFEAGISEVTAEFIPTLKNAQVSDFYSKCGFEVTKTETDGRVIFSFVLNHHLEIENLFDIKINF